MGSIRHPYIQPILIGGDSNSVGLYEDISIYPPELQQSQLSARVAYYAYAHQPSGNGQWFFQTNPNLVTGKVTTSGGSVLSNGAWWMYLAKELATKIENTLIVHIGQGGTTIDYLNPQVNSESFNDATGWAVARLAAAAGLGTLRTPIYVSYTGTNGPGSTGSIQTGYQQMMAGMRGIWPAMPVVCLTIPTGSIAPWGAELAVVRSGIASYVGLDPLSRLVDVGAGSFFVGDSWPLLHIDRACGADFAARTAVAVFDILGI